MKLIVGLGNPGGEYKNTRHNTGFLVLEKLKTEITNSKSQITNFQTEKKHRAETFKLGSLILAKPTTFMNESGIAVSSLYKFYKISNSDLYVIHDDLDIKLGEYKIQLGKGPKIHNGLLSIYEKLGTNTFWHVRVGIENREMNGTSKISGEAFVLQDFSETEKSLINDVIDKAVSEMLGLLSIKTQ